MFETMSLWAPPATFLGLTLALALALGVPGALATHGLLPAALAMPLLAGALFSPGLAAVWLVHRQGGSAAVRRLGRQVVRWRAPAGVYLVALLLPFVVNSFALSLVAGVGGQVPALPGQLAPEQQADWWLLPLLFLVPSAVEEIGWRGYALPRLQQRHTALTASVVIGVVWAVWHLPLGMVAGSTQGAIPFGWYTLATVAMSVVLTWMYNAAGGALMPVILLHAGVQVSNAVLPVMPTATGEATTYLVSVALYVSVAVVLLIRFGPRHLSGRRRATDPPAAPLPASRPTPRTG